MRLKNPLIGIGYGNLVAAAHIIAVVSPESAPIKRMISDARELDKLIDATCGRRTRSVVIANSDHIILSALLPETIARRMNGEEVSEDE